MTADDVERLHRILEGKGEKIADLAGNVLLEGIESEVLKEPLKYLVSRRKDLLRPALMRLACEAVGGSPGDELDAAVAMVLACYYIGLIDDVIDETKTKRLSRTLPGRFGIDVSLLVSIILNAKANFAINRLSGKLDPERFREANRVFKDFLVRMVEGEALNVQVKRVRVVDIQRLVEVFEMESADIEACTRLGAIIGNGVKEEVEALGQYGRILGTLFLLCEDFMDALNFSIQLGNKLAQGAYPFPVLWAANHSNEFQDFLSTLKGRKKLTPIEIKRCVQLLFNSGAIDHTTTFMEELAENAINSLKGIQENEAKKMLELIARVQPQMAFKVFSE